MHKPHPPISSLSLCFFLVCILLCTNIAAQTQTPPARTPSTPAQAPITLADSLKTEISRAGNNTEKLSLLQALCRHSGSMPADTLKIYTAQALQLALQQQDLPKIWESKYMVAFSLQQRSLTDSAQQLCDQLLKEIHNMDKNFALYHETMGLKAMCLKTKNQIKEASTLIYQTLASAEKFNDRAAQIDSYNLLTIVAGELTGFDDPNANDTYLRKCIGWYMKAISLFQSENDYKKYDRILANLGMTYYQLPKSNYDSALYFIDLAIRYAKEQNQLRIIASCSNAKGNIFHDQGKYDSAEYYYKQEVAYEQRIGDPSRIALSYSALRNIYRQKKDYKTALAYDRIEWDYCLKNHVPIDPVQYVEFAQDYKGLGNYKAYGEMLDTLITIKDSLYQANSAAALAEIQTKYEVEKKENTIIQKENTIIQQRYNIARKRSFLYIITSLLVLIVVVSFMILRNRKEKQQRHLREMMAENDRKTRDAVDHAKEDERRRIIADLHDDVGGGLSTIRMVSDLIAQQDQQTQQLNAYAGKISSITKEVTQRMNTIVWALNAENDTVQNLIEYIREYGAGFFENSPIRFRSNLPEGAADLLLSGLQRKNIFLCVKEALNNIYKHSGAKNAWIDIKITRTPPTPPGPLSTSPDPRLVSPETRLVSPNTRLTPPDPRSTSPETRLTGSDLLFAAPRYLLTISVCDDGKGIANENPFGNGLKNIQSRMAEINGEARFDTPPAAAPVPNAPASETIPAPGTIVSLQIAVSTRP